MVQYSFAFVKELTFSESEAFKAHSHPEILQAVLLSRAFIVVSALAFGGALVRGGTRLFRPLWMEIELAELNQVSNHETDGEQTLTGAIQDLVSALAAALRPKS